MSLITGVSNLNYYSSLYAKSTANSNSTATKTDTAQSTAATSTGTTTSTTAASPNNKSSSIGSNLASQILASLLNQEQSNMTTLLNPSSGSSSDSNDSLYNILELSANYTLMKNGIDPSTVLSNAEAKLASASGSGSSTSSDATTPASKTSETVSP